MLEKMRRIWEIIWVVVVVALLLAFFLPALQRSPRSKSSPCATNLRQLGIALHMYAQDYEGNFPDSYESFTGLYPHYVKNPKIFWCLSDVNNKKAPKTINNWEIDGENSSQISYEYIAGFGVDDVDAIIVQDNTPANHLEVVGGKGVWAVFGDGHAEWMPIEVGEK